MFEAERCLPKRWDAPVALLPLMLSVLISLVVIVARCQNKLDMAQRLVGALSVVLSHAFVQAIECTEKIRIPDN